MISMLKFLTYLSALGGTLLFIRPKDNAVKTLIWFPKMISAALTPLMMLTGALGALAGLIKQDGKLTFAGALGAGLAARFISEIPDARDQFASEYGRDWQDRLLPSSKGSVGFKPDLVIGQKPNTGKPFIADIWQPQVGSPRSGLGLIYAHGSGWRVGDKDMLTRPFFHRLAEQGHVVLDIAYTLYPEADMQTMVREVNQAILWMKKNSQIYQIDPERIVLMGGSAGAHLSLLAAYAPQQPEFQAGGESGDTSVRGVVAFYPAVDLCDTFAQTRNKSSRAPRMIDNMANAMFNRIFQLQPGPTSKQSGHGTEYENYLVNILGGTLEEIPDIYALLSPIQHVGKDCPPTLLLQGSDDVFDLAPPVKRLHRALQEAGVPVILVEYPHTEHGFDLILPQISPIAQAAAREVEKFLDLMK